MHHISFVNVIGEEIPSSWIMPYQSWTGKGELTSDLWKEAD